MIRRFAALFAFASLFVATLGAGPALASETPDGLEEARPLPPEMPSVPALAETHTAAAMPLERDLEALKGLHEMLTTGDRQAQGTAAHRLSQLADREETTAHLKGFQAPLKELMYDYEAPVGTRLMALSALYRIAPKTTLYSLRATIEDEPSTHVRAVMKQVLGGGWETDEMGPVDLKV